MVSQNDNFLSIPGGSPGRNRGYFVNYTFKGV